MILIMPQNEENPDGETDLKETCTSSVTRYEPQCQMALGTGVIKMGNSWKYSVKQLLESKWNDLESPPTSLHQNKKMMDRHLEYQQQRSAGEASHS